MFPFLLNSLHYYCLKLIQLKIIVIRKVISTRNNATKENYLLQNLSILLALEHIIAFFIARMAEL